jgi:hypothetical protein
MSARSEVGQGRELDPRDWGVFFEDLNRRIESEGGTLTRPRLHSA